MTTVFPHPNFQFLYDFVGRLRDKVKSRSHEKKNLQSLNNKKRQDSDQLKKSPGQLVPSAPHLNNIVDASVLHGIPPEFLDR